MTANHILSNIILPCMQFSSNWREALKFINKCPLCGNAYDAEQTKLFARRQAAHLVHLTCGTCRSYFIAMIVAFGAGVSSVGMVTDLNFTDARRLYQSEPLTLDEALVGYSELHSANFNLLLLTANTQHV